MKIQLIHCFVLFLLFLLLHCLLAFESWGYFFLSPIFIGSLIDEERLSLSQVAQRLNVNTSTVWRWALTGVRGVKLETFSIGAKRFTTEKCLLRFIEGTTRSAAGQAPPLVTAQTSMQRQSAISDSERYLDSESI